MLTGDFKSKTLSIRELNHRSTPSSKSRSHLEEAAKARQSLESVDYDLHESEQYVSYIANLPSALGKAKGGFRWFYTVLAGFLAGAVAVCIQFVLKFVTEHKFDLQAQLYEDGQHVLVRYAAWLGLSLFLAGIAGALVCYVEPLAGGSGIPEIKCILNGIDLPPVLQLKTLVAKAFGIVCSVAAGLPCGKEGPMIHSGAICGAQMSRLDAGGLKQPYKLNTEARDFVAAGAAAGVAAAFGAPIGGVLFAIEEGATHMNPRICVRTFVCASAAALTVRFFAGPMEGTMHWGLMGTDVPVEFGRFTEMRQYRVWELAVFAGIGVFGGLAGALFNGLNTALSKWRMRWIGARGHKRFLEVFLVTGAIVSCNFFAPLLFSDSGSEKMRDFSITQRLWVDLGGHAIRDLLHEQGDFAQGELLIFAVVHYAQTVVTYGLGVPSGLFVPSLLAGATFGRSFGQVMQYFDSTAANAGVYALIGATAMLSGMARITISLAVILMETTGEAEWGLPIFLTVMTAKWTGDLFNKGIYDIHIELRHVPLLEGRPEKPMLLLQASDLMATGLTTLNLKSSVEEVLEKLDDCRHHAFPVIDPISRRFLGMVERNTLHHVLLLGRETGYSPHDYVSYEAMVLKGHPQFPQLRDVRQQLDADDLRKSIDLSPYTNLGCYTVQGHAAAMRCYNLFRTMGLRHLPVLTEENHVRGIITRKDLLRAMEELDGHTCSDLIDRDAKDVCAKDTILGNQVKEVSQKNVEESEAEVEEETSHAV